MNAFPRFATEPVMYKEQGRIGSPPGSQPLGFPEKNKGPKLSNSHSLHGGMLLPPQDKCDNSSGSLVPSPMGSGSVSGSIFSSVTPTTRGSALERLRAEFPEPRAHASQYMTLPSLFAGGRQGHMEWGAPQPMVSAFGHTPYDAQGHMSVRAQRQLPQIAVAGQDRHSSQRMLRDEHSEMPSGLNRLKRASMSDHANNTGIADSVAEGNSTAEAPKTLDDSRRTWSDDASWRGAQGEEGVTLDIKKKARRKLLNRESAQRSRARRAQQVEDLSVTVNQLSEENAALRARIGILEQGLILRQIPLPQLPPLPPPPAQALAGRESHQP
ncbi:hypothetical protein FVE85_1868 [Porphyridium purpureum]|uniref:BZIP domain-containing protein n=1 Tax=Porphyridium purpureum TaxID=35688 RepID=A0A5J4YYL0_PORPP|nr:hypothetical protein FVE85_1868 [Porphyridium purpureum]|eukprot:POR3197..scf209_3